MFRKTVQFILIVIFALNFSAATFAKPKRTKIVVISALHQLHEKSSFYTFEDLARLIEKQKPDVLAVELTAADLKSRREQKVKQEYARAVFPLADKYKYTLLALEPGEPEFSEIVALVRDSEKELRETSPGKGEAFTLYNNLLYEHLFKTWKSPADVNSARTDAFFEIKHNYQNALFGEKQARGWEMWNRHFLETILAAAEDRKGKKIAVIVGLEHAYWLRKKLSENKRVILLNP